MDACPHCRGTNIEHQWVQGGGTRHVCKRCGEAWGEDPVRFNAALCAVLKEEREQKARERVPSPGPDLFLLGVNPIGRR